jgi:hypothetical protein
MKSKMHHVSVGENRLSGNDQVRIEIETFLQALNSYPEYFSKDPETTFEKYCSSLVPAGSKDADGSN